MRLMWLQLAFYTGADAVHRADARRAPGFIGVYDTCVYDQPLAGGVQPRTAQAGARLRGPSLGR